MQEVKIKKAEEVIKDALSKARNPFVAFTGGKDSLVTLHLVKQAGKNHCSVLFIDTSAHFDEIYQFVEKIRKLWGLKMIKEKNEEVLSSIKIAEDKKRCCSRLKAKVLKDAIKKYNIDYLFTGIRQEEQETRRDEEFVAREEDHVRINPVVHFTEIDIWDYITSHNLPYCSLYDKGYRNIDCIGCTALPPRNLGEAPSLDSEKEAEKIKEQLKGLGYIT